MRKSDLIKYPNIWIKPADHKVTEFISPEDLSGDFWDSVKEKGIILYDVGYALFFTLNHELNKIQTVDQSTFQQMLTIYRKTHPNACGVSSADHIELPLRFGFDVIIVNYDKWFNYNDYYSRNYETSAE